MALKLSLEESSSLTTEITFSNIYFSTSEEGNYYILSDSKKEREIKVRYSPSFISDRNADRYECFLFENLYLTAENDVFELKETTLDGRLGWIFPISALESNENDYADHNSFKHYRHIAYQKLLAFDFKVNISESRDEFQISELFHGITVCILSKDEISNLDDFRITDYALSLLKYDYLIYKDRLKGRKSFNKNDQIRDIRRGNHKLRIKKSAFDITANQFTNSLFIDHVYQTENILTKYILLYQILEHFIQEYGNKQIDDIIADYKADRITKNTLKERIGNINKDRHLLKKTFEKTEINRETRSQFLSECGALFGDLKLNLSTNFEDAIYDLRNLITHNFRLLTDRPEQLGHLTQLFELVILDLLINFNQRAEPLRNEQIVPLISPAERITNENGLNNKYIGIKRNAIRMWNSMLKYLIITE